MLSAPILTTVFQKLSILDRLLTPAIVICMIVGVFIGEFVPGVQQAFDTVRFYSVSVRKRKYCVLCPTRLRPQALYRTGLSSSFKPLP
ncbi:uncharacterized protein EDB91DRAFT_1053214 [Suillus paluster]|uniref:uncharacterized protein n=1 Tax=Suillus paluster TaxID=48578 RepID=UPI001B879195|nr:uncharacterized protein EDB91DRAFT_1053214 [Suillus paluster]KAG1740527.1 hypothetical protein EDB91DRAFT_1053214 [Suillus paluster]